MKLGFVSAILPELSLKELIEYAAQDAFGLWPMTVGWLPLVLAIFF